MTEAQEVRASAGYAAERRGVEKTGGGCQGRARPAPEPARAKEELADCARRPKEPMPLHTQYAAAPLGRGGRTAGQALSIATRAELEGAGYDGSHGVGLHAPGCPAGRPGAGGDGAARGALAQVRKRPPRWSGRRAPPGMRAAPWAGPYKRLPGEAKALYEVPRTSRPGPLVQDPADGRALEAACSPC